MNGAGCGNGSFKYKTCIGCNFNLPNIEDSTDFSGFFITLLRRFRPLDEMVDWFRIVMKQ